MSLVRVVRTAQQTLTRKLYSDEVLTDVTGPVTVSVTRLDGTLVTSGTATDAAGTGTYTFVLPGGPTAPASATWQLDALNVAWTGSFAGAVVTFPLDHVEVVGDYYFGLPEARARHSLSDTLYTAEMLAATRIEVEQEAERICGQAFVPRFARIAVSGNDTPRIRVPWPLLRTLRAVTIDGTAWSAPDVAAVAVSDHGVLTRPAGALWPAGSSNIVLEYEHGWDYPPEPIRTGAMLRLRSLLGQPSSGVPDRASSFTVADGGVYRLSLPTGEKTGITAVDGAYAKYPRQKRAVFA